MQNSRKNFSLVLAAIAAGLALFTLLNASFTAFLRGDVVLAITSSLALLAFAICDFSHRPSPIDVMPHRARLLRPALPASRAMLSRGDPMMKSYRKSQIAA